MDRLGGRLREILFFHTYVGSGHFWRVKLLSFNILGVFRKINIFLGMKI